MTGEEAVVWLGNRLNHRFRLRPRLHAGQIAIEVAIPKLDGVHWRHVITMFEANPFGGKPYVDVKIEVRPGWATVGDLQEAVDLIYDQNPDWHKDALEQLAAIFALGDLE